MSYNFKTVVDSNSTLTLGQSTLHNTSAVEINGANNQVEIGNNVKGKLLINILGANSRVIIGDNVLIMGALDIVIRRGHSTVIIGENSTFQGLVRLYNHEPSSITIGTDCMFGGDILATTSDMHAIYDADHQRINPPLPISFGEHVWVGAGVRILKGATIGLGSIVGMSALVVKGDYPNNCILAGNPAKVVRSGIYWTRNLPAYLG